MLAMFEPTTLPSAMPGAPAKAALREVTSSGIEVPKPTIVSPISRGDSPIRAASATAPRTSRSPPAKRRASPATRAR